MRYFMEVREIYKKILAGEQVEGWSLMGNLLYNDSQCYQITGTYRLHVKEVPHPKNVPLDRTIGKKENPPKLPDHFKKICEDCGSEFIVSKFNPYFTRCPNCARKKRIEEGEDRAKICLKCGETFYISKFRPYADPQYCPKCSAKLRRVERKKRKERDRCIQKGS